MLHEISVGSIALGAVGLVGAMVLLVILIRSFHQIGADEVGLVLKRIGRELKGDNPIALNGEAGYQAELLKPGLRFRLWPIYSVDKHPWVQVPPGQIGLVIAQVGEPLSPGAKSGIYKPEFGDFTDVKAFIDGGGQKGVQRPVNALRRSHYGSTAFLHFTARRPMPDSAGALPSSAALVT